MSEDNKIIQVGNYLKRNYVKKRDLRFTYLPARPHLFISIGAGGRFMLDTAPKLLFYQIHTIVMPVN